jgi:hypothetical protein
VRVWLAGRPVADGSLQVSSGRVELGTRAAPDLYAGAIGGLDGGRIEATVRGAAAPPALAVSVDLRADESGRTVSGTLRVRPATVTGP